MEIVIASLIALPPAALVVGALSGHVKVTSCCTAGDPSRDLRMRAAFEDERPTREEGCIEHPVHLDGP